MALNEPETRKLRRIAENTEGPVLLILFGSRGRNESSAESDWDLAYRGDERLDVMRLRAGLAIALQTDAIDLVNLDRTSGLLRYRAARDGVPVFEANEHAFERFWLDAVDFWCDAHRVLQTEYDALLERLSP